MPQTRSVITFSKREGGMPMPHLLDIQTAAFETLLVPDDEHNLPPALWDKLRAHLAA